MNRRKLLAQEDEPMQIDLSELENATYEQHPDDFANGVMVIHEPITEKFWEKIVRPLKRLETDRGIEEITFYLSTPGGDVEAAMSFCDVIDAISVPTHIILFETVCSAGMLMACSGSKNPFVKTYCYPSTLGVMHKPSVLGYTERLTFEELGLLTEVLERRHQMMRTYIVDHTNFTFETYDELITDKDLYLTAQQMKEYGIVDEIITGETDVVFL